MSNKKRKSSLDLRSTKNNLHKSQASKNKNINKNYKNIFEYMSQQPKKLSTISKQNISTSNNRLLNIAKTNYNYKTKS